MKLASFRCEFNVLVIQFFKCQCTVRSCASCHIDIVRVGFRLKVRVRARVRVR